MRGLPVVATVNCVKATVERLGEKEATEMANPVFGGGNGGIGGAKGSMHCVVDMWRAQ